MLWLLLLVLVVVLYQAGAFNPFSNTADHKVSSPSALDVLNERYARGEVSTEEYLQVKATLNSKH